jgi:hypothetical protein
MPLVVLVVTCTEHVHTYIYGAALWLECSQRPGQCLVENVSFTEAGRHVVPDLGPRPQPLAHLLMEKRQVLGRPNGDIKNDQSVFVNRTNTE